MTLDLSSLKELAEARAMTINEYLRQFPFEDIGVGRPFRRADRVVCADGFSMSVQAHDGAYCSPRMSNAEEYTACEIGFPSARVEELMPYIDGGEETDPTDTVYGYVPVKIIEEIIAAHGGFAASDGWKSMESAPRDGTRILCAGGGCEGVQIAEYLTTTGAWGTETATLDDRDDDPEGYSRPTHWRPLPPLPTKAED